METRVILRKEPIEKSCWDWCVGIREHDKSRKVYSIDPFVEVYQFHENIYNIYVESADGMGDPWIHLILGEERALLIDTGFGIGNLKGLVEELLQGKPYDVAITHPHPDHAWGCCQFDKVYCHRYAVPVLESQQRPDLWDGLTDEDGNGIWYRCNNKDIISFKKYNIIGCDNHKRFELGPDHEVELIFMPGHAPGECCFLDHKNRILFAGDTVLAMRIGINGPKPGMPFGEYATVTAFRNELSKLVKRKDEFDEIYPSHFQLGLKPESLDYILASCNQIIADPDSYDDITINVHGKEVLQKKVEHMGTISYTKESV